MYFQISFPFKWVTGSEKLVNIDVETSYFKLQLVIITGVNVVFYMLYQKKWK